MRVYFPMNNEFLCKIDLFAEDGKAVAKTKKGQSYGKRFDDAKPLVKASTAVAERMDFKISAAGRVPGSSRRLPRLDELFLVQKPGRYKVRLQFQIFRLETKGSTDYFKLVRFPPLEYEVTKEGGE